MKPDDPPPPSAVIVVSPGINAGGGLKHAERDRNGDVPLGFPRHQRRGRIETNSKFSMSDAAPVVSPGINAGGGLKQ